MSDITTHLMLPYILAAQAQKHVTHNDALRLLDAMVQLSVLDRNRTAPPLSPVDGDRHIVAPTATGSWAGWDLNVAFWVDGVWMRLVPRPGWTAWSIADAAHTVWNGTAWVSGGKESEQMVNRLKLNEKALRDAEPKPGVSYQIFDTEVIGFAARIQASGARTFTIDYRHAGRQRRMNIGRWPEWSVTAARERAKELRRTIDEGNDPLATREDFREAPRVKDMITRYIAEHLPKLAKNNAADQTSMLKKMVEPTWGKKLVTEITKSDVARFLDFVAEGRLRPSKVKPNNRARKLQWLKPTPIRANRTGEVLRKMFTLASVQSHRAAASCNVKWTRSGSAMPHLLFFLI